MSLSPINFPEKKVFRFRNSPDDEKRLIRNFFDSKSSGFYVEVGANNPTVESQTFHLEQLGWDGLLIEPLQAYCELLKAQRKGKVIQLACSSPENHNIVLPMAVAGTHSTLNDEPIALGTKIEEYQNVTCRTLDSILEDNDVPGIDFISIDIEGHEMEMFKGFSLQRWSPRLVLLEDHVMSHAKHRFMTANGYQLIMRTGLNSWYVPADKGFTLTWFAKLQMFRKLWLGLAWRKLKYHR